MVFVCVMTTNSARTPVVMELLRFLLGAPFDCHFELIKSDSCGITDRTRQSATFLPWSPNFTKVDEHAAACLSLCDCTTTNMPNTILIHSTVLISPIISPSSRFLHSWNRLRNSPPPMRCPSGLPVPGRLPKRLVTGAVTCLTRTWVAWAKHKMTLFESIPYTIVYPIFRQTHTGYTVVVGTPHRVPLKDPLDPH